MRYCFSALLVARQSIRRRLAHALLVVAIAFGLSWVSEANAQYPPQDYKVGTSAAKPTAAEACAVWSSGAGVLVDMGTYVRCQAGTSSNVLARCYNGLYAVYANSTVSTMCATQTPPDCTSAALKNKYVGASVQGTATSLPGTICIQGCAYPAGSVGVQVGTSYATDIGVGTGATCTGANYDSIDTTTKATDPPSLVSCSKKGMVYGTVNGVGICAAAGTIPNSTVKQQSTSTTQTTDASGVQAAPQTEGTTVIVSNVGGVPRVTETKTNPDGSKTETTEDQTSYCQKNPTAQVCKEAESTASGGADCTTPPSCSGDAIQCMMVNQQWRTRCDSNQPSSLSDLGSKLVNGQDPVLASGPSNPFTRQATAVGGSIDQTAFLSGGGLSDKVVTVSGQSITLPFSRLNQYLVWIGHLFVVLSLIGAIRIVLGGFK